MKLLSLFNETQSIYILHDQKLIKWNNYTVGLNLNL